MTTIRATLLRSGALALLWWLLTQGDGLWYYGIPVVVAATAVSLLVSRPTRRDRHPWPARLRAGVGVVRWFLVHSVTGGLDVGRRVVGRRLDIDPVDDHVPVRVASAVGRVLLADLGSLTPGSLSVDLTPTGLDVHVLHREMPVREQLAELDALLVTLFDPPARSDPPTGKATP
ncbi:Na+/H+ antiporter subunit E [Rhodococcoides corynebacterioides]|uniref:Na+/H+ antiporter subunit E n=1 Tax=Rhodococcoides corynebacterioides TaxID=53972 RepID=UPI001C9B58AB|nr:Na+/H+ antiporter subunit E [Rhodococcus corynebacterioides]MBY6362741.1 Na+/H+ antiporter subunit E [Rhodococcus corynebacterioides]